MSALTPGARRELEQARAAVTRQLEAAEKLSDNALNMAFFRHALAQLEAALQ